MKLNITLHKNMTQDKVNNILESNNISLILIDDVYLGNSHVHNWKCECGETFLRTWMYIRANNSTRCKSCVYGINDNYECISNVHINSSMSKEYINNILNKWIYFVDDKYINAKYKHRWKCKCGNFIVNSWDNIRRYTSNIKCKSCQRQEIKDGHSRLVHNYDGYKYVNSYFSGDILPDKNIIAKDTYLEVIHKYCGSKYTIKYANFIIYGQECGKCCGSYENSFAYYIEKILGEPLEKYWDFEKNTVNPYHIYKNYNGKVWIKCQSEEINKLNGLKKKDYHGSYEISCNKFVSGKRCGYCKPGGKHPKVHPFDSFGYKHFDKVMSWHPDNDISPFRVALNSNDKFKFKCYDCGTFFDTYVYNINTQDSWCSECSMSVGEKSIVKWLRYNGIDYEYEKEYCGLIGIRNGNLSYDFYLPKYNLLIEYQGRQHSEYIPGIHEIYEDFENQKEHDRRKREYAKNNNIRLLEIWEEDKDNIEEILNNFNLEE